MKRVLLTIAMFATLIAGSAMTASNAEARPPAWRGGTYGGNYYRGNYGYYGGNYGPSYYGNNYYRPSYAPYFYPRTTYRYPTYYGRSYSGYPTYNRYPTYRYGYRGGAFYY